MKRYQIAFLETAEADLDMIWYWVARESSERQADEFIASIYDDCESLAVAPKRGTVRRHLGENVRLIGAAKGRVSLLFEVGEDVVWIVGVRYAGRRN